MFKTGLLLLLLLPLCQCVQNPQALGCERMYGEFGQYDTYFKRPMEIGDRFVVNGRINDYANIVRINLNINESSIIAIHMRADINERNTLVWDSWIPPRGWTGREYSPLPWQTGQPYEVAIELTANTFDIYFNNAFLYSYKKRTPAYQAIAASSLVGTHTTNWIELACKNPPITTTTRRPRPPGNGHGHGHGNGQGHGHGHGHGGGKFSSSSSSGSDESCE